MTDQLDNLLAAEEAAKQLGYLLDQLGWGTSEAEVYRIEGALKNAVYDEEQRIERIKDRILGERVIN